MWEESSSFIQSSRPTPFLHQKRKGESLVEIMPPLKMHINEEKMVSQLKGIHLSNSYTSHESNPSTENDCSFLEYILDSNSKESESLPSLKMCDELKSQFNPTFKFKSNTVPSTILDKFNKECTALVLWQPPINSIGRSLSINGEHCSNNDKAECSNTESRSIPSPAALQEIDVEMMIDDDNNNNNSMRENSDQPVIDEELQP